MISPKFQPIQLIESIFFLVHTLFDQLDRARGHFFKRKFKWRINFIWQGRKLELTSFKNRRYIKSIKNTNSLALQIWCPIISNVLYPNHQSKFFLMLLFSQYLAWRIEYQNLIKLEIFMKGNHLAQILQENVAYTRRKTFCKLIFMVLIESDFKMMIV